MKILTTCLMLIVITASVFAQNDSDASEDELRNCTVADWESVLVSDYGTINGRWQEWAGDLPDVGPLPDEYLARAWRIWDEFSLLDLPECQEVQDYMYNKLLSMFSMAGGFAFYAESNFLESAYQELPFEELTNQGVVYFYNFDQLAANILDALDPSIELPTEDFQYEALPDCTDEELQTLTSDAVVDYFADVSAQIDLVDEAGFPAPPELVAEAWELYAGLEEIRLPKCLDVQKFVYHVRLSMYLGRVATMLMAEPNFNAPAYDDTPRDHITSIVQQYITDQATIALETVPE